MYRTDLLTLSINMDRWCHYYFYWMIYTFINIWQNKD